MAVHLSVRYLGGPSYPKLKRAAAFEKFFEKHRCTEDEINLYFNGNVYAWVLGKVSKYENTVAYTPRQGAVMWVRTR